MPLLDFAMQLPNQLVLGAAFAFMALVLIGGIVKAEAGGTLGGLLRGIGNLGLALSFGLTIAQLGGAFLGVPIAAGVAMAAEAGTQMVRGEETRVPLGKDGHYWVEAEINGVRQRFLIDTGATYTTISSELAGEARIDGDHDRSISLHTANGDTPAKMAEIRDLRVGNIAASDTTAIIAPDIGTTNVLGMNFLSALEGWRVEGKVMVLTPALKD